MSKGDTSCAVSPGRDGAADGNGVLGKILATVPSGG
jgi:hypothetical protein